tara:strand:- start:240 stop:371 length:132 start_codon:yes stop_codon:yes gene_type:complete
MQQRALTHNPRPLKTLFDLEIYKKGKKGEKKKKKKNLQCFDAS